MARPAADGPSNFKPGAPKLPDHAVRRPLFLAHQLAPIPALRAFDAANDPRLERRPAGARRGPRGHRRQDGGASSDGPEALDEPFPVIAIIDHQYPPSSTRAASADSQQPGPEVLKPLPERHLVYGPDMAPVPVAAGSHFAIAHVGQPDYGAAEPVYNVLMSLAKLKLFTQEVE